jgi:hypothetical protein
MSVFRFEAEVIRGERVPDDVVRERIYSGVRVIAHWPEDLAATEIRVALEVRGEVEEIDAPAYVELFFHDVFLLLNLSSPGSFDATIATTGGELRVRELELSARVFEYAGPLETLPLERVSAWYDGLQLGTRQIASDGVTAALFQLLHLARSAEDEEHAIVRLANAAEGLIGRPESLRRLFELREAIAYGRTLHIHPMHDDGLDPRVEDATREWIDVTDAAANAVIAALQRSVSCFTAPARHT